MWLDPGLRRIFCALLLSTFHADTEVYCERNGLLSGPSVRLYRRKTPESSRGSLELGIPNLETSIFGGFTWVFGGVPCLTSCLTNCLVMILMMAVLTIPEKYMALLITAIYHLGIYNHKDGRLTTNLIENISKPLKGAMHAMHCHTFYQETLILCREGCMHLIRVPCAFETSKNWNKTSMVPVTNFVWHESSIAVDLFQCQSLCLYSPFFGMFDSETRSDKRLIAGSIQSGSWNCYFSTGQSIPPR